MSTTQEMNAIEIKKLAQRSLYIDELEATVANLRNEKMETHKVLRSVVLTLSKCQGVLQAVQEFAPNGATAPTVAQDCEDTIELVNSILLAPYTRGEPLDPRRGE